MGHIRHSLGGAGIARAFSVGLLLLAGTAFCEGKLGSVTYLEGDVSMIRDGAEVDNLAIGADLQNFDLVRTGSDGLAELDVNSSQSPRMTIKVSADTQFSVEIAAIEGKQQTTLGIIGGSISLKASRLAGTQALSVKTDSAVMGVRGTQFDVTAPPTGDVLVTCDEGEVVVTDDQGKELHAIPGTVVEKRPAELYRTMPVAVSGLAKFRGQWSFRACAGAGKERVPVDPGKCETLHRPRQGAERGACRAGKKSGHPQKVGRRGQKGQDRPAG